MHMHVRQVARESWWGSLVPRQMHSLVGMITSSKKNESTDRYLP